ncbi:hypothetical protein [Bacillus sp. RAR_GA_16]|uniref:hypothetical protein n=1 Tax=Bacillus sp. RAR_GA_16 TaxID=2876774 RepID=UPI001CCB7656|nr:hypothetical protein [Bacillus sp. RAR_GA_16]MCA0173079.1 hypothetical protein [Bacillus sp. RAR_GA_16]
MAEQQIDFDIQNGSITELVTNHSKEWSTLIDHFELKDVPEGYKDFLVEMQEHVEDISEVLKGNFTRHEYLLLAEEKNYLKEVVERISDYLDEYNRTKDQSYLSRTVDNFKILVNKLKEYDLTAVNRTDRMVDKYQEKINDLENRYKKIENERRDSYSLLVTELKNKGTQEIDELERLKKEFKKTLERITDNVLEEKYEKAAKHNFIFKNIWQGLTIFSLITMVWLAINTFNNSMIQEIKWYLLIGKLVSVGTLGSLAVYSAIQAKSFDGNFNFNKKMALRLATLNPFLSGFDEVKKQQIKEKLVYEMFADDLQHLANETSATSNGNILLNSNGFFKSEDDDYTKKQMHPEKHP